MKQTAKIIAMLAIGMQATGLHAVPAMPGAMRMTQPDGTEITVRLYGCLLYTSDAADER